MAQAALDLLDKHDRGFRIRLALIAMASMVEEGAWSRDGGLILEWNGVGMENHGSRCCPTVDRVTVC